MSSAYSRRQYVLIAHKQGGHSGSATDKLPDHGFDKALASDGKYEKRNVELSDGAVRATADLTANIGNQMTAKGFIVDDTAHLPSLQRVNWWDWRSMVDILRCR